MNRAQPYSKTPIHLSNIGLLLRLLTASLPTTSVAPFSGSSQADVGHVPRNIAPVVAPFQMPQPRRPTFAQRTVNVLDHGAVGDGQTMNTAAIAQAIDACARAGIRMKSTRGRGGVVENIWIRDIDMRQIRGEAIRINTSYRAWFSSNGGRPPIFRRIHLRNISCRGAAAAASIHGLPEQPLERLRLENVSIHANAGFDCGYVQDMRLSNVTIHAATAVGAPE